MTLLSPRVMLAVCAALAACTPALNWRDVRPEASGARLLMPCKPSAQQRNLVLAGSAVRLTLLACSAGGLTWGLAHSDVADLARVPGVLAALRSAAAANLGATGPPTAVEALAVPGATPNASAGRTRLAGRLPDGTPVQMELAVFVRGTRVFQASALGERLAPDAVDNFFTSIRFE